MKNKNKMKKIFSSIALGACVLSIPFGLTGCGNIQIDQSKADALVEKSEQYLDTQNALNYEDLAQNLQQYLDKNNKVTNEDVLNVVRENTMNLIQLSRTNNFTFVKEEKRISFYL